MRFMITRMMVLTAMIIAATSHNANAAQLSTAFTYQGQLKLQGMPLDGTVDLEVSLFDVDSGGVALDMVELNNVSVTNGLFIVELDFGAEAFNGNARWLEVAVRSPHDPTDAEAFTTLTPRQPVTATPYALQTRGLFVSDEGNVGIGTTTPQVPLSFANILGDKINLFGNAPNTYGLGVQGFLMQIHTDGSAADIALGYGGSASFTEKMRIDNSTGNVGIGTTTPASKLDVAGTVEADGLKLNGNGAAAGKVLVSDAAGNGTWQTQWTTNGSNISYSAGNVGIGTNTPAQKLDVVGGATVSGPISARTQQPNDGYVQMKAGNSTLAGWINWYKPNQTRIAYLGHGGGGVDNLGLNLDSGASFNINGGNVGIGTTTPNEKLTVNGVIHSTTGGVRFPDGTVQSTASGGGGATVWAPSGTDIYYNTGNVGIGKAVPAKKLHVGSLNVGSEGMIRLESRSDAGGPQFRTWDIGVPQRGADTSGDSYSFVIDDDPLNGPEPEFMIQWGTGNVGIGTTAPTQKLDVAGNAAVSGSIAVGPTNAATGGTLLTLETDAPDHFATIGFGPPTSGGKYNDLIIAQNLDSDIRFRTLGVDSMVIRAGGKVGIGANLDPSSKLSFGTYQDWGSPTIALYENNNGANAYGLGMGNSSIQFWLNGIVKANLHSTGLLEVGALQINGGADLVEGFDTQMKDVEPGTLMVIDPEHPGQLMPSTTAYDSKVAGIVSGAGGVKHGLKLGQDSDMDGDTLVAMTGRAYVKCTTAGGSIMPGDLLTTSAVPGHAMKAADRTRAPGATIGKAMSALDDAEGLVLVLVNLQ